MTNPKAKSNMNKFDYYCLNVMSYIGGFGCWIAFFACIWIVQYRWQLFWTGTTLLVLNMFAETAIRKYKEERKLT